MSAPVTERAPAEGTVERWAWDYLHAVEVRGKLEPPEVPTRWSGEAPPWRVDRPGRPVGWTLATRAPRTPGAAALRDPVRRAQLAHTFLHHEVQAAELFCWAILRFPAAPEAFRRGLLAIARDEVRHAGMYRAVLHTLGREYGELPVRDWFWERVPGAASPAHFVATLGVGLEGANLDHAARFGAWLREAGADDFAAVQARVGDEEVAHVRFAWHWLRALAPGDDWARWTSHLVAPLSPWVMRALPLAREARLRGGFTPEVLAALEAYAP